MRNTGAQEQMELQELTAKQKRLQVWGEFFDSYHGNEALRLQVSDTLQRFRNVLAKCWESETITPDDAALITDLERQLEELHEQTRLVAGHP